jgi:DNA ligase (NAD+)
MGIPNIGINASHLLVNEFGSIDSIMEADAESLTKVQGIGEVVAQSVISYFKSRKNRMMIEDLKKIGLKFAAEKSGVKGILQGKTFVFTGELSSMTREEAQALVRRLGGHPSSTVSKQTDFVVAGENPGSKYDKARKLGVRIIDEKKFLRIADKKQT